MLLAVKIQPQWVVTPGKQTDHLYIGKCFKCYLMKLSVVGLYRVGKINEHEVPLE
jgi:hypothetical protein